MQSLIDNFYSGGMEEHSGHSTESDGDVEVDGDQENDSDLGTCALDYTNIVASSPGSWGRKKENLVMTVCM